VRTAIIIQARTGSSRLPAKVLKKIGSKTMLEYLLDRTADSGFMNILAVPSRELKHFRFLKSKYQQLQIYGGSEENVLDRYYKAAAKYNIKIIIRVTADNPFTCVAAIKSLQAKHILQKADISYYRKLPYGSGSEIISWSALKKAWKRAASAPEREHITQYFYKNKSCFKIYTPLAEPLLRAPQLRLTVDTNVDFKQFKKIVKNIPAQGNYIRLQDIIAYFKAD